MWNPWFDLSKQMDFIGEEQPEWDNSTAYYRINVWSDDHAIIYRWIYYRVNDGALVWEVQPESVGATKLNVYSYGE